VLNVVDHVRKESFAETPDTSIFARRVLRELTELIERRRKPGKIVSDNWKKVRLACAERRMWPEGCGVAG
jgi:hypothetical protein